ncbi:MAG: GxxExxY protein [Candidatus Omnitrophota bacterium]|jgi:GxxExxY protein
MITDKESEISSDDGLYKDLTYQIIGALYCVHNDLGHVHKENIYHNAVAIELRDRHINFEEEKSLLIKYKDKPVGHYRPDFIIDDKVVLEIKAVPTMVKEMADQAFYYIKGTKYKLVLLANFGTKRLIVKRRIYT